MGSFPPSLSPVEPLRWIQRRRREAGRQRFGTGGGRSSTHTPGSIIPILRRRPPPPSPSLPLPTILPAGRRVPAAPVARAGVCASCLRDYLSPCPSWRRASPCSEASPAYSSEGFSVASSKCASQGNEPALHDEMRRVARVSLLMRHKRVGGRGADLPSSCGSGQRFYPGHGPPPPCGSG